jgi:hypothetical protein
VQTTDARVVAQASAGQLRSGDTAVLCVRHEFVDLVPQSAAAATRENQVPGTVRSVTFTGSGVSYECETSFGPISCWQARAGWAPRAQVGDAVLLTWDAAHVRVVREGGAA